MALLMWVTLLSFSCLTLVIQAARKIPVTESCPLCDFVYNEDGVFNYEITHHYNLSTIPHLNIPVQTYVFNMTALKYLEGYVDEPVWWHTVIINVPDTLLHIETAFVMLARLMSHERVDEYDKDLIGTAGIAMQTGSITAAVYHIPKDPINYRFNPTGEPLDSDESIIFTILSYYDRLDPNVLIHLPMTKVAAKTMDLIQDHTPNVRRFVIGGESKRGWVTWLIGAIDDRVEAIIPAIAGSFIRMDQNVHHSFKSFGGYSFFHAMSLYGGLFNYTDSIESRKVARVIDPLSYAEYLDIPKLVIIAASDELFLPDSTQFWFNRLHGDNKLWILENRGHFLELYPNYKDYWDGMGSFYASIIIPDFHRPCVSWKLSISENTGRVQMFTSEIPKSVKAFYAKSVVPERRDFRTIVWCPACTKMSLCSTCPNITINFSGIQWSEDTDNVILANKKALGTMYRYSVTYDFPQTGYLAFFMQMVFDGPGGTDMTYTSELNIIPDTFPSTDCEMEACGNPAIPIY